MKNANLILLTSLATIACTPQTQFADNSIERSFAPEITRSFELRREYNQPVPVAESAIYIDSVAVHHSHSEGSTVVWLDAGGHWQWSQVSKTGPGGLLDIEPRMEHAVTRQLTQDESRTLESLLSERSLYRGVGRRTGEVGVGAPFHVMEIVTPMGHVIYRWDGRLLDEAGMIADLALGHN